MSLKQKEKIEIYVPMGREGERGREKVAGREGEREHARSHCMQFK